MSEIMYQHITILGHGLIGSSVARACKQFGVAQHLTAYDSNPLTLELGKQQGFIDAGTGSIGDAVKDADLVILAAPPTASLEMLAEMAKHVKQGALVTDVLSVKTEIAAAFQTHFAGKAIAVPSHPIAGSEKTGAAAGRADLFVEKRIVLTPQTPEDQGIERISQFWEALGGQVEYMPPEVHDMVYAYVSHLPQMLAFAFAPHAKKLAMEEGVASHFAQFTRLCQSDKHLWEDIFSHNKQQLDPALARFLVLLSHIRSELANPETAPPEDALDDEKPIFSNVLLWSHWVPRLMASCLVAAMVQQSRDVGFSFHRFAGSGFSDFTSPLMGEPDVDMQAISSHADKVVAALDQLLTNLAETVVTKD